MRPDQVSTALTAPPEVPLRAERWNLRPWSSRRRCMMPAPKTAWLPPPWQAIATRGRCAFLFLDHVALRDAGHEHSEPAEMEAPALSDTLEMAAAAQGAMPPSPSSEVMTSAEGGSPRQ